MRNALRIVAICLLSFLFSLAHAQTSVQQKAIMLKRVIERNHISPRSMDDQFSTDLFDSYISVLDPDKLYFTQADSISLSRYRSLLDDELQNKGWSFFPFLLDVYKKRLQQADSSIVQITQKPFDFNTNENWTILAVYAKNEAELKTRWTKFLKYKVLSGLSSIAEMQLQKNGAIKKEDVLLKEPEIRNKSRNTCRQRINRVLNNSTGFEQYCAHEFMSVLATCFDPHTSYFDKKEMEEFESELNTEGYYFGFSLTENDKNEIVIGKLMPGSAAWKCGQLNKDDVLLQIQQEGQEPTDLSAYTAEEANEMLDEFKSAKINLTIRKANGLVSTISLQKEKVENDDQHVKSFILAGKQKMGYVYLPGFYTIWDDDGGSSCAADMAKEIVKLKKDGIEGIILDMRYNGGGSLQEAVELAGIFIEDGPLCQFKARDGKIVTLKDMNRGTIWDGPMVLLVNGQSASATELVASALQDYNRAIIAGSVTYGKGTGQQIAPLDTTIDLMKERRSTNSGNISSDFVKITNGRLYRVTGKSVQGTGIQPDIVLPDIFEDKEWHESHMPFYLKPDTVKRNNYYHPLQQLSLTTIKQLSTTRVAANPKFEWLKEWSKKVGASDKTEIISLRWAETEKQLTNSVITEQNQKKNFTQNTNTFKAGNHSTDKLVTVSDSLNERWLTRLVQDPYVEECYNILSDLIQNK